MIAVNCGEVVEERILREVKSAHAGMRASRPGTASDIQITHKKERKERFMVDVVTARPLDAFRLIPGFLRFDALGERRTPSATVNIRILLALLLPAFTNAHTNISRDDLKVGADGTPEVGRWEPPEYKGELAFRRATSWLMNRAVLARDVPRDSGD